MSESTRPRLPWAPRIRLDVAAPLPLLDVLHADPTRYVTRSVANHVNDISKVRPDMALAKLRGWRELGLQDEGELTWMTRHALRTLVKQGHAGAMELLGFSPQPRIEGRIVDISPSVHAGEALEFSVELRASQDEHLLIDYVIDFVKANGGTSPKVFKLKQVEIGGGETLTLDKRHVLKAEATTYTLYPGTHTLTVVVNGFPAASTTFDLLT